MDKSKLLVAGGDMRMLYAAEKLSDIYDVETIDFDEERLNEEGKKIADKFKSTNKKADILLFPAVMDERQSEKTSEFLKKVKDDGIVLIGAKGEKAAEAAEERGLKCYNYMKDEVLALANAVPTAEAALKTAMEETGRTIWGSRVLVTGFGRIGEILTDRLIKLGADVTAAARKEYDRMKIKTMGGNSSAIMPDRNILSETDIIFNTVPARIFGKEELICLKKDCVFVELASKPGGIKKEAESDMNCKYVWASGLPPVVMSSHK